MIQIKFFSTEMSQQYAHVKTSMCIVNTPTTHDCAAGYRVLPDYLRCARPPIEYTCKYIRRV